MTRAVVVGWLLVACRAEGDGDPAALTYDVPQHPFLAANGTSNLHDDAYMTDTYAWPGPEDVGALQVVAATLGGECASVVFDAQGRLITLCVALAGGREFVALDPHTLERTASWTLPSGGGGTSFAAGGYFVLDEQDHALVPTTDGHLLELALEGDGFTVVSDVDLTVGDEPLVATDGAILSVLPDWSGRVWFVTEHGAVGWVDGGASRVFRLDGEEIGNSIAVDETGGVYVVSDHALYRFDAAEDGAIATTWREAYDRGTRLKPGQVNFGSGTTPTLLDDDLVAITDNADPRMHVLVYDRRAEVDGDRKRCEVAVFGEGEGATDNSLIGFARSFVVENNYGYGALGDVANDGVTTPGIARVVVGSRGCEVAWTAPVAAPSVVPKVSLASRALYTYEKAVDGWWLVALDVDDGEEIGRRLVGTAYESNNHWAPLTLAEDGTVYVGTVFGLTALTAP